MRELLCSDKCKGVTIVVKVSGSDFLVVVSSSLGLVLNEGGKNDLCVVEEEQLSQARAEGKQRLTEWMLACG